MHYLRVLLVNLLRAHSRKFGATVKEINSLICSTSSNRRKQARRSLICAFGSSGSASGRNLRSCSLVGHEPFEMAKVVGHFR